MTEVPEARVHVSKWSPWVWIVPAAAIFIAGFLVVRYGFFGGGDITVHFVEARGLDRYSPVRFRGAKVGTVQKITIDQDLKEVVVRISMDASMSHALVKGTRFWIVEPGIEGGGIGGLLSGTYVAMAPGSGESTREFEGQEYPPVLAPPADGKTFILFASGLGSVSAGSPVTYQGFRVGRVLGAEYDEKRSTTLVYVWVAQRFAADVKQSTRFWRGGGLSLSFAGSGLSLGDTSLSSILNSPISFYTPDVLAGSPAPDRSRFQLFDSRGAAVAAAEGPVLTYRTYFPGPLHGLTAGTPVQMKGVQVGTVTDVRLRYLPGSATLETPVTYSINPQLLEITAATREDLRRVTNEAIDALIRKGMRATLSSSLVLPGASAVTLDPVGPRGTARLIIADPPVIPAAAESRDVMASINDVANTVRSLPLREIAENVRNATARVDRLVSDPALSESLQRLNRSMAEIERISTTVGKDIGPIVQSLRNASAAAEQAAASAQQLVGSPQLQGYDIGNLIKELTRAADSIRALADYLAEHPDSLLKGRGK